MNSVPDKPQRAADRRHGGILMRFIRARAGATAIEFAIGFPIFLAMLYGVFEIGRIFWTQNTMEFAIGEAARFTMVNPNAAKSQIIEVIENKAVGLDASLIGVVIVFEQSGTDNSFVNITGTYSYAPMVPLVLPVTGGGSIDFQKFEMDIVTSTRMALVIP